MASIRKTSLALAAVLIAAGTAAGAKDTGAKPAGIGFKSSPATLALVNDAPARVLLTLKMKTPAAGFVVYAVDFMVSNVGKNPVVECSLAKGSKTLGQPVSMVPVDEGRSVVSFRRVLKTKKKAKINVALKCAATGEPGQIIAPNLIGTYVPAKY